MDSDLRKKEKNGVEKYFVKFLNNAVYGKCTKIWRYKLVTTAKKGNYLVPEPNFQRFSQNLLQSLSQ